MLWKRGLLGLGIVVGGFLLFGLGRGLHFSKKGAALVRTAEGFSREYALGQGAAFLYVSLGDSTAMGVGVDTVEKTMTYAVAQGQSRQGVKVSVRNFGESGAVIEDVVENQLPKLPKEPISLVTLSISANDATHGTKPAEFEKDLVTLLDGLQSLHVKLAVVTTTPNFHDTPALPRFLEHTFGSRAATFSEIIRRVALRYPFVRVADLNLNGGLEGGQHAADGFHPNAEGYRIWVAEIERAISTAGRA